MKMLINVTTDKKEKSRIPPNRPWQLLLFANVI